MIALVIALFLLVVGTGLLLAGADWFLDGASDLARVLGISVLVLGGNGEPGRRRVLLDSLPGPSPLA